MSALAALVVALVVGISWQLLSVIITSSSVKTMLTYRPPQNVSTTSVNNDSNNSNEKTVATQNIVFVFAHPDDEAMFFTPTLYALKQQQLFQIYFSEFSPSSTTMKPSLHFVCLTRGNYDKLGDVREKEMHKSAKFYGVDSCTVIEDARCQDGPVAKWDDDFVVKEVVEKKIINELQADIIITFDRFGVSGHKNHGNVYACVEKAVHNLRSQLERREQVEGNRRSSRSSKNPPRCYRLVSLPIWRKYSSIFGVLVGNFFSQLRLYSNNESKSEQQQQVTILLPPSQGLLSMQGLWNHKSQFVWFRFFYVLFASYSYENILEEF